MGSITGVFHEADGTWLFFPSGSPEDAEPREVCIGCILMQDPSISNIADLSRGWGAWRRKPDKPWQRRPSYT
jgi:hypothetical protein